MRPEWRSGAERTTSGLREPSATTRSSLQVGLRQPSPQGVHTSTARRFSIEQCACRASASATRAGSACRSERSLCRHSAHRSSICSLQAIYRLEDQIRWYERAARRSRYGYIALRLLTVCAAAAITIVSITRWAPPGWQPTWLPGAGPRSSHRAPRGRPGPVPLAGPVARVSGHRRRPQARALPVPGSGRPVRNQDQPRRL